MRLNTDKLTDLQQQVITIYRPTVHLQTPIGVRNC